MTDEPRKIYGVPVDKEPQPGTREMADDPRGFHEDAVEEAEQAVGERPQPVAPISPWVVNTFAAVVLGLALAVVLPFALKPIIWLWTEWL